mmetsp:Transcript_41095/g.132176  ORF Transcript_41095/g.132176 Transcript_41095/m.132176 type:complete len:255 (-) Transcript_41095:750-1514(-)
MGMYTWLWWSWTVVNVCVLTDGSTVLRGVMTIIAPPSISMPRLRGVTSTSTMSQDGGRPTVRAWPSAEPRQRSSPWIAAPMATASSGLTLCCGNCERPKNSLMSCWILGIRVLPPTITISSMSVLASPASFSTCLIGSKVFVKSSAFKCSNFERVSVSRRSWPLKKASTSTVVLTSVLSARFASSTATRSRCIARRSPLGSLPALLWNCSTRYWTTRRSKSSPPRCVLPHVARVSKTPPSMESSDTSKVPPPKS